MSDPPNPASQLWIRSDMASGSSLRTSGQPVRNFQIGPSGSQSRATGATVAWCTYWKWALSGPFSATTWGCTGSATAFAVSGA